MTFLTFTYTAITVFVAAVGAIAFWDDGEMFLGFLWLVLIPLASYTFFWTVVLTFRVMHAAFFG